MNQQPVSQVPPGQFQPVFVQTQAPPGQPVQVAEQVQPVQSAGQQDATAPITTAYWKSALDAERLIEFLVLLAAWISITTYSDRLVYETDGKVNFFKGITVFCWVMVIIFQVVFVFGFNKAKRFFSRASHFTIICFVVQIILTILLVACTANLVPRANDITKFYDHLTERGKTTLITLYLALIFGFLACICFLEDVRLFFKMIITQREEEATENAGYMARQPGTDTQSTSAQPAYNSSQM